MQLDAALNDLNMPVLVEWDKLPNCLMHILVVLHLNLTMTCVTNPQLTSSCIQLLAQQNAVLITFVQISFICAFICK